MAVTREGIPVRLWTSGDTSDQTLIRTVKDDLRAWNLHRVIWVPRSRLQLRPRTAATSSAAAATTSWARSSAAPPTRPPPHWPARAATTPSPTTSASSRYASTTASPVTASSSATTPTRPAATPRSAPASSPASKPRSPAPTPSGPTDRAELAGRLKTKPGFTRFLRATPSGKLRINRAAVRRDAHYDGKYLLRTADESLTPDDIAEFYKALYEADVAGVTSRRSRSTCARCSTARTNGSKPTSSCAGWRCCCCGS